MKNLLIAFVAGSLFTVAQIFIDRLLKHDKGASEASTAPRDGRRDEILWIAVASGVFVFVVFLCLSVWESRSGTL